MSALQSHCSSFRLKKIAENKTHLALAIWFVIVVFCFLQSLLTHRYNNYLIFENTFRNLINQTSLYAAYPNYHADTNHYGPIFGVFFSPFAMLPNSIGLFLWDVFNVFILFKAIESTPFKSKSLIYFVSIPCVFSSFLSEQFNPTVAAFIILSYTLLNKNKGIWATMLIVLGTFIKLYGIVGLAFFFFVKDKKSFILYFAMWSIIFFMLPMLFSSPQFVITAYQEWAASLIHKNESNMAAATLDISIMGFVRTLFSSLSIPNSVFLLIGIAIFGLPYLRFKSYSFTTFQLQILSSTLIFPILFSTGSEDCTYIIAIVGVGIWYLTTEKKIWKTWLLYVTVLFSCNLPFLLFRKIAVANPVSITMLSLPFFIVWLLIIVDAARPKIEESYA